MIYEKHYILVSDLASPYRDKDDYQETKPSQDVRDFGPEIQKEHSTHRMSQSIQDIPVGKILPLDHMLQLADRSKLLAARVQEFKRNDGPRTPEKLEVLTSTMDEVEQTLRPYAMAVLDCMLGDIYENILREQDGTKTGFDEAMTRITRALRPDPLEMDSGPNNSTHTFSLEETLEIAERFRRLILGFEDLDRLTHQPVHVCTSQTLGFQPLFTRN